MVGVETITQIEGVVVLDLPPPGVISGTPSGTVAMAGEFPDMSYAVAVDATGAVTTSPTPVEISSGQDLIDKVGGFDSTLGDFGDAGGNGFAELRNKSFSRLVLVPVNLASAGAGRCWRDLPTNTSATVATPVVPMAGGRVEAGRQFNSTTHRVMLGKRVNFTTLGHYKNGTDGAVTAAGSPGATQTFNSAGSNFLTAYNGGPVPKGAILVLGVLSGAGALGANAYTLRVTAQAASDTALVVEKMDGSNFDWSSGTTLPFRIHPASDADTGSATPSKLSDTSGYTLPCRPIDATVAAAATLAPNTLPTAGTASTWNPLSGLTLQSHVTNGFAYTAGVQAPNVTGTGLDALYASALTALLQDAAPARDVNVVFSARTTAVVRAALKTNALGASASLGRMACVAPPLSVVTASAALASASPGVGATTDERVIYDWPGAQTFVPEAAGLTIKTADGLNTTDGVLDTRGDGWMAAVLSNLAPERNPGQAGAPVDRVLSPILGIQRGVSTLSMGDYINMKAGGIAGLRIDRKVGPIFQSGITSSLTSGQKNIARRRMADFIEDSVAQALLPFTKQPLTEQLKDDEVMEIDTFLDTLLSPSNPPAQRIAGYVIDDKSGNTKATEALGIFVIIAKVRTLASQDEIVFQASIGEAVDVSSSN
jgi:hypothetical protein